MVLEVEKKALLTPDLVDKFIDRLKAVYDAQERGTSKQLNHYFRAGDANRLKLAIQPYLNRKQKAELAEVLELKHQVRTRWERKNHGDKVLLVIKGSNTDDAVNGSNRKEVEIEFKLSLSELDAMIGWSGYEVESKWSRSRQHFTTDELIDVFIDWNAGYGPIVEFEAIVSTEIEAEEALKQIDAMMRLMGVQELDKGRLQRMYAFYKSRWQEYYRTDKVFMVN